MIAPLGSVLRTLGQRPAPSASISGKRLGTATKLWWNSTKWTLSIECDDSIPIWVGDMAGTEEAGPEGVYTRTGGTDTTATLEIVACHS